MFIENYFDIIIGVVLGCSVSLNILSYLVLEKLTKENKRLKESRMKGGK